VTNVSFMVKGSTMTYLPHHRIIIGSLLFLLVGTGNLQLHGQTNVPVAPGKEPALTDLFKAINKVHEIKGPDEQALALTALATDHPELIRVPGGGANMAYAANNYIKANIQSPEKLQDWLDPFISAVQADLKDVDYASSDFDYRMSKNLLDSHVLLPRALQLAIHASATFSEEAAISRELQLYEERQERASPTGKKEPFNKGDATAHFQRDAAARYSLLGDLQVENGQREAALGSYDKALTFSPNMGAFLGEAKLKESLGDKAGALALLFDAYLTGNLQADSIEHMKHLYLEVHPGSNEAQMSAALDALYKDHFRERVRFTNYQPVSSATTHTVLAELFTGAGCEPCMAPDLAFDAALKRYNRSELVLLVHHDNAPAADPLANDATEERAKYYSTGGGTPHAYLDGKPLHLVEGLPSHAQDSADKLFSDIDKEISRPTVTHVTVSAERKGDLVDVTATAHTRPNGRTYQLHIDLLEKEVSYSGENSLRFHPMVVRATAEQSAAGSGFLIPITGVLNIHYTFKLSEIEASNLGYYDRHIESIKKRSNGLVVIQYREKKASIRADHLAVAAFIQNDSDKEVLQSAYADVHSGGAIAAGER